MKGLIDNSSGGLVMDRCSTVVSAAQAYAGSREADWRVIDVRFRLLAPDAGWQMYRAGHVPGAAYLHLEEHLSGPAGAGNGRHPLPEPDLLADRLARAGVENGSQVVVYDDAGGAIAARLWWLMRWLGHDNVAVMNGGYQAWVNAGYPICAGEAVSSSGSFVPRTQPGMILETREIESGGRSDILLIDVRERDRFLGVSEPIDSIAGRIPGAVNLCYLDDLDSDRFLRESGDIRSRWQEILGDRPPDSVACMCGSGVTACLSLLAMEVAGLGGARLYAGSWSEWITDCRRPVVTGPGHLSRG
jgi:thiosulfate/3-mercaptopyruvate sulfurtransferase